LMFGVKVRRITWVMIAVSFAGLCLLTGSGPTPLNVGDFLTLGAAIFYGVHIALLDRHSKEHPPVAMAFAQTASATVLLMLTMPLEGTVSWPNREVWEALLITGVLATCVAFLIQVYVQQRLSAVATVLILSLESVFAALFGWILLEETLTGVQFLGMALMIGAVVGFQCMSYAKSRSSNNSSKGCGDEVAEGPV
jgi:drug/metabolite transporter (DMT)-like permease